MGTTITLTARDVTITITGDGVYAGCTYDRLDGWYGVDNVDLGMVRRPNSPGAFDTRRTFPGEKPISIEGKFFGTSRADALQMREDLALLYNEGETVTMTVADDLRTTSRDVKIALVDFPWTIHPEFNFTIDATAADPRRYGEEIEEETGLATPGTGMSWPIVWPIDWGTLGVSGRVEIRNDGNTETSPRFVVSGGRMPDGFAIVNVTEGKRITYLGPITDGVVVEIDGRSRTATINGAGAGARYLASPEWFTIPRRSSIEVQFLALGPVEGAPTLHAFTAPAYY